MNINQNTLPKDRVLPKDFNGKEPLKVVQAVIGEDDTEPNYKVLCGDGSYAIMPLSAFPKKEDVPAEESPAAQ